MDNKFETWANQKFEGLSRDQLREAGKAFGCSFGPNTAESTMRFKLCEKVGQSPSAEAAMTQRPDNVISLPRLKRPRLSATDVWEGRRHRVLVNKGRDDGERISFVLTWDGCPRAFEYGKPIDMPEPYFNILKMAKDGTVRQRSVKDEEGRLVRMESYDVWTPKFAYNYMGVTPGTEHLPGSILEYWQNRAKQANYFRDLAGRAGGRKALVQILSDISEPRGPQFYKDLTDEDILVEILRLLGFEDQLYNDIEGALG